MRIFYTILFALVLVISAWGQKRPGSAGPLNVGKAYLFSISYGLQTPAGDLIDRFGPNANLGLGLDFLSAKGNWTLGFDGNYLFGQEVKTNVLANLLTPEGYIIGNDKTYADIQLRERGFFVGARIGKIISLFPTVHRSGIKISLSTGLFQHKIRIQKDPIREVPQLSGDYRKGYDRLTNGLAFSEFIGYQMLSANRRINFYAGIECLQAFTQSRRDFNFDTRERDKQKRLDMLFGIRVGWILPFYFGKEADEVFY